MDHVHNGVFGVVFLDLFFQRKTAINASDVTARHCQRELASETRPKDRGPHRGTDGESHVDGSRPEREGAGQRRSMMDGAPASSGSPQMSSDS